MKASLVGLLIATAFSAGVSADWSSEPRESDGQTQFYVDVTGEVPLRCRMYTEQNLSVELGLEYHDGEKEFKFGAWCNNDSASGELVVGAAPFINQNNNTDVIPLIVKFNEEEGRIDAENNAGSDTNYHAIATKSVKISNDTRGLNQIQNTLTIDADTNGWEKAGEYKTSMYVSLYPL